MRPIFVPSFVLLRISGVSDFKVDVETPAGEQLAIDDPRLMSMLREGTRDRHELTLLRSESIDDRLPPGLDHFAANRAPAE